MKVLNAFLTTKPVMVSFVRRFFASSHDIEDICQETVTRALEAEKKKHIEKPRAFLFGVVRNVVRKRLDKQSKSLIDFVDDFSADCYESNQPTIENCLDERQRMLLFAGAVATLPRQCQRVFVMKKVYGYSHKEIAAKLEISVSTVEKHVATGLKRSMDQMEKTQRLDSATKVSNVSALRNAGYHHE